MIHSLRWYALTLLALLLELFLSSAHAESLGDFRALPTLNSDHGVLSVTLKAERKQMVLDGASVDALTFNGEYAGPVMRVKQGDAIHIQFANAIDETINFHFHGYHGSPLANGDNMHIEVEPGRTFEYSMNIPQNQPPGLYWYHTHIHHHAESQINKGLSGAIIVEGMESRVPETKGLKERLLVLKTFSLPEGSETPDTKRLHGIIQTINGLLSPIRLSLLQRDCRLQQDQGTHLRR